MKIFDMINMCLRNLWRRKGRTMLTIVGVVIGSCAVIVMISLGLGMSEAMDNMLQSWGDLTSITIYNGGNMNSENQSSDKPKLDDDMLKELSALDHVSSVVPKMELDNQMITIAAGRNDRYRLGWAQIIGVDFSKLADMNYEAEQGEFPKESEYSSTVVMGSEIAYQFRDVKKKGQNAYRQKTQLADGSYTEPFFDPVGTKIKFAINNTKKVDSEGNYQYGGRGYEYELTSVCVLKQDTQWETPYAIFIDISLAKEIINNYNRLNSVKKTGTPEYSQIKLVADDINSVDKLQEIVEGMGLDATSMAQVRKQMQGELGTIEMVLGGLAAISLLVAAISITNTMIMSIYERTREIGIMKVLGCFIGNIRSMFLIEAGLIGLLGGIIGTIISYIISFVMNNIMGNGFAEMMGIYVSDGGGGSVSIIPIWLVLLALGFSTLIGLISGYYPANRAVKISALEAIKNE